MRNGQKAAERAANERAADIDDTAAFHQHRLEVRFEKLEESLVRLQQERQDELATAKASQDELVRLLRQGVLSVAVAIILALGRLGWTTVQDRRRHAAGRKREDADKEEVLAAVREGVEGGAALMREHAAWEREGRAGELARAENLLARLAEARGMILDAIDKADQAYR